MTDNPAKPLWTAAEIANAPGHRISHPWNPQSDISITPLSAMAGLTRVQLSLGRVPPGKESFIYHSHEHDEEFLYILEGKGRAEIQDKMIEVGPGDFMGFPAPGVAHHLTNPYDRDLVYLMGGERSAVEVGHFPRLGRRIIFGPAGMIAFEEKAATALSFDDYFPKDGK